MKKRPLLIALTVLLGLLLIAAAVVFVPILTHQSAGGSGQNLAATSGHTVTAVGEDGNTRTLTVTTAAGAPADMQALHPGEVVTVHGTGYDSGIGIYVSFCQIPVAGGRPGPCLGEIPATEDLATAAQGQLLTSAWITDDLLWRQFATHGWQNAQAGEFKIDLLVPAVSSNGLDCTVTACALVTRADHTALKDRVQDIMLPVQFETVNQ